MLMLSSVVDARIILTRTDFVRSLSAAIDRMYSVFASSGMHFEYSLALISTCTLFVLA